MTAIDRRYQKQTAATANVLGKHCQRLESALNALRIAKDRMGQVGPAMARVTAAIERGRGHGSSAISSVAESQAAATADPNTGLGK